MRAGGPCEPCGHVGTSERGGGATRRTLIDLLEGEGLALEDDRWAVRKLLDRGLPQVGDAKVLVGKRIGPGRTYTRDRIVGEMVGKGGNC